MSDGKAGDRPSPREFCRLVDELTPRRPYWVATYVFSPWARYLSWLLVRLRVSANTVTSVGGVLVIAGSLGLALPRPAGWVIGSVLLVLFYTLDVCDGQMARLYRHIGAGSHGMHGQFLSALSHALEPMAAGCLGYRLYVDAGPGPWPLVLAGAAMVAVCLSPYLHYYDTVIAWMRGQAKKDQSFRLSPEIIGQAPNLFLSSFEQGKLTFQRFLLAAKQVVLIPGYFLTLVAAVVLDIAVGPAATWGGAAIHWRFLWLGLYAAGKVSYALYWGIVFGRRLRSLPA